MKLRRSILATAAGLVAALFLAPAAASAHTVQICWQDNGPVTTFYAGTYHQIGAPTGLIILDGFGYPFSGLVAPASLPPTAHCYNSSYRGAAGLGADGVPLSGVYVYQTFTLAIAAGSHTIDFSQNSAVEYPWEPYPAQTFGGGACADADFDGICNSVDACPLDAANDGDRDRICGNVDNCPLTFNPNQSDGNGNGQGDVCEGQVCGNGLVTGAEQCDDGNIAGGDGCSAICTLEIADGPPNANAGTGQSVNEGQTVNLDGSQSNDPDNDALTFAWTQIGGTAVTLAGAGTSSPTFTAPSVALGGETLTFRLTVTANGLSDTDAVSITVVNVNHTPVALAGIDQTVAEGSPVTLNGGSSFDQDGDAISYTWTKESGPAVIITGANTATPSFTAPTLGTGGAPGIVGTLVFTLRVDDGYPADAAPTGYSFADVEDTIRIDITNVNNDPSADAGTDLTLNENGAVQLNGNGSTDPDGDGLTYGWAQIGGTAVVVADANTATPSFTTPFVSSGGEDLTFEVTVDDGYGGTDTDTMVIHVQNINDPPLASAAYPTIGCLWPPNHKLVLVGILGVSDPEDNATITIDSVWQDEPVDGLGDGDTSPDAIINPDGTVLLRAERSGKGDGRVYHVRFTASDLEGSSSGEVTVCVALKKPQSTKKSAKQSAKKSAKPDKSVAIDGGSLYDATAKVEPKKSAKKSAKGDTKKGSKKSTKKSSKK